MLKIGDMDHTLALEIDPATGRVTLRFRHCPAPAAQVEIACEVSGVETDALTAAWLRQCDSGFAGGGLAPDADDPAARFVSRLTSRAKLGLKADAGHVAEVARWLLTSRETTNYSYGLTRDSLDYMAHAVALATGRDAAEISGHIAEALADQELHGHVAERTRAHPLRWCADDQPRFGRRLGWYAVVRACKPATVVETGVDKGLGAVLLCAALRRNAADGQPGRYLGIDIDREAGYLLSGPYAEFGRVVYGDSVTTLRRLASPVGVFINDSDHREDYETREYQAVADKLAPGAIVLSDNSHVTPALMRFAEATGRRFLFFRETPKDHWYPGAGIGFAF